MFAGANLKHTPQLTVEVSILPMVKIRHPSVGEDPVQLSKFKQTPVEPNVIKLSQVDRYLVIAIAVKQSRRPEIATSLHSSRCRAFGKYCLT